MKTIDDVHQPRYLRFAQELRDEIRSGNLKPGDRLPSFTQVRAEHGLSQATWDKVHALLLSENLIISERGRGTFVSPDFRPETARVEKKRTGIIGVSGHGFGLSRNSVYWANVMDGVCSAAQAAGVQILLMNGDDMRGWDNADGVLLLDGAAAKTARHYRSRWSFVGVMEAFKDFPHVVADDYLGAHMATRHLVELGHRRIAYMHAPVMAMIALRREGYRDALYAAEIDADMAWEYGLSGVNNSGEDFVRAGRESMEQWLAEGWADTGCTALLAQNDEVAIGAIQAFRAAGIEVPRDVSVVGFDGISTDSAATSLTTIEVPLRQMGSDALEMLLLHLDGEPDGGPAPLEQQIMPVQLRVRQSTAAPSLSNM